MPVHHCQDCPTRRLCLADGLDDAAMNALSRCVRPGVPMQPGAFLYRAGDPARDCFVVRSGAFKTVVTSASGAEHVTGFHLPGEVLGLSGQSTGCYEDSAVALETSTACRTPLADMPRLWQIGSGAALLRMLGRGERQHAEAHTNLSRTAADARVAGFLTSLARRLRQRGRATDYLPLPMTRTDLANYLGMSLESLSRVLGRFARAGLIASDRGGITCHDPAALQALADHLDRPAR